MHLFNRILLLFSLQLRRTDKMLSKTFSAPTRSMSMQCLSSTNEQFLSQKTDLIAELKMSKDIAGVKKMKVERAKLEDKQATEVYSEVTRQFTAANYVDQVNPRNSNHAHQTTHINFVIRHKKPHRLPLLLHARKPLSFTICNHFSLSSTIPLPSVPRFGLINSTDKLLQVPDRDHQGNLIPDWKRQMLAKKAAEKAKKEFEDRLAREAEDRRLSAIPKWKRDLMARKEEAENKLK